MRHENGGLRQQRPTFGIKHIDQIAQTFTAGYRQRVQLAVMPALQQRPGTGSGRRACITGDAIDLRTTLAQRFGQ